jgi:predicted ATPase
MTATRTRELEPTAATAARGAFAAWRTASPLTSFVGREAELHALDESVSRGRFVTLVGPPGIGKTRLVTRFVATFGAGYNEGGAWFCDLTAARDGDEAKAVVCATLGIRTAELPMNDEVGDAIGTSLARRGKTLLVLDNFEQLVQAGDLVASWCKSAPDLHVVVTSRERLRVPGETVLELGPLELPSAEARADEILASEAALLFADRASGAGVCDRGGTDATAIGALVRALDGIPLAIELAAGRARTLAPAEILSRLTQRFDVLKLRGRDAKEDRHATLERAIDWSWELLEPAEQRLLAQCSVFVGGFTLAAAEQVLALEGVEGRDLIDVLDALCDKSLVTARPAAGTRRFALYVSIRDYAAAKLGDGADARRALDHHASHYLGEAERWADAMARRADPAARALLLAEQENLAAVYHRSSGAHGAALRPMDAIRAVLALYPILESHGPQDELMAMLDAALSLSDAPDVPASARARVLFDRGCTYGFRGKVREGIADLEAALAIAERTGDEAIVGEALVWLSVRYRHAGRYVEAIDACNRAEGLLERNGLRRMMGLNLAVRGRMRGELGQRTESYADNERAMSIFRELGDRWYEGLSLANLGQLDMQGGDLDQARWYYEQALVAFREVGDPRYEGIYLGYLGCLDWEAGDPRAARTRLEHAIAMLEKVRTLNTAPLFRAVLGSILATLGDLEGALRELDRADNALIGAGVPAFAAASRCHRGHLDLARARLAATRGQVEEAARLRQTALGRIAAARELVDEAVRSTSAPSPETDARGSGARLLECSDDVRFSVRMLERSIGPPTLEPKTSRLTVGPEGRWFAVDASPRVDLVRRGPIRLILSRLVRERLQAPTVALSQQALLEAGWPGERVLAEAGSKRVRVAISTLRRLGLGGLVVTQDDGYLLDARSDVRIADRDA